MLNEQQKLGTFGLLKILEIDNPKVASRASDRAVRVYRHLNSNTPLRIGRNEGNQITIRRVLKPSKGDPMKEPGVRVSALGRNEILAREVFCPFRTIKKAHVLNEQNHAIREG